MADFTIDNLPPENAFDFDIFEEYVDSTNCRLRTYFGWWALGHNFDVVATILAMAELSWERGFDTGRNVASFIERGEDIENCRHALYPDAVRVGAHPGN